MRGQAFIVFEKMEDAIAAMKKINGKLFFNKKLVKNKNRFEAEFEI